MTSTSNSLQIQKKQFTATRIRYLHSVADSMATNGQNALPLIILII